MSAIPSRRDALRAAKSGLLVLSHQCRQNDTRQPDIDHQDTHLIAPTSENHPDSRSG